VTGPGQDADDDALVALVQGGCGEAFAILYERRVDAVRRFLYGRTRDPVLVQDLTSETFLHAWQGVNGFAGGNVEAWLTRIAHNRLVDHFRLARVRRELPVEEVLDLVADGPGPAARVLAREESLERSQLVQQLLDGLTAEQRRCLTLRFFDQHDIRRTADALGRSEGAVKLLQHRGLNAMRRALSRA
jgi:RNA polymerase sigma-70 factor, ECF subfamily